jgi:hypothetical protein
MTIYTREHTRKWACIGPINMMVDGNASLDECTRYTEGWDELLECGFMEGHDTPKRDDVYTTGAWSSYNRKGAQPKEGIEYWQEICRRILR